MTTRNHWATSYRIRKETAVERAALTGHRVAPGETLTPGSGGGGALAS